jgi:hypothetical protein
MKKIVLPLLILLLGIGSWSFGQGRFSATVVNVGNNVLTFKLKPDVTTTAGFSVIEFFLRYPTGSPSFTYGSITANTTNFPGMTTSGNGAWYIERNNPVNTEPGYNVDHFIYTAPGQVTDVKTYTGGTEYDLITVPVVGNIPGMLNVQLVNQNTENLYYLAITGEKGNDLRPSALSNYFYPATATVQGPAGSLLYFMTVVLPVKLFSFSATVSQCNVNLSWHIANEVNLAYYGLERSEDGVQFLEITRIPLSAGSTVQKAYSFSDEGERSGKHFYRLRLVDADGHFTYSAIKEVSLGCSGASAVKVYPTLSNGVVTVQLPPTMSDAIVKVFNSLGQVVVVDNSGSQSRRLDLSRLISGSYMVKIFSDKTTDQVKIILQR